MSEIVIVLARVELRLRGLGGYFFGGPFSVANLKTFYCGYNYSSENKTLIGSNKF